jgi:catechol 2,3-dioxygenase-like lactoylglutathione lyase family enzyme
MINGAHIVLYTTDPEADRAFFRDVLNFSSVDAGHGWLIFALPPAEAAFHDFEQKDSEQKASSVARAPSPAFSERTDAQQEKSDPATHHELFLMCDDIAATLRDLKSKHVPVSTVSEQRWGNLATLTLPGGGRLGIYEPKHPRPPEV